MKRNLFIILLPLILTIFITSCGKKEEEENLDEISMDEIIEKGQNIDKQMQAVEAKIEQRKKKGDTIATDYNILLSFIPDVAGWQAEQPEGSNLNVNGTQYSLASKTFKNSKGEEITIELYDYNTSLGMLTSSTMWKNYGLESDNNERYQKVSKFDDIKDSWIYEEINKVDKITNVNYSLNDRYLLSITVEGQTDLNYANKLAKQVIEKGKTYFNK
jgi:hypothetical protein